MGSPDCFLHAQLLVLENSQKWAHYSKKPRFRTSMTLLQNNTRFSDAWAATRTSGVGAGCRRAPTGQHKDATMGADITYQSVRKRISPCRRCIKKKMCIYIYIYHWGITHHGMQIHKETLCFEELDRRCKNAAYVADANVCSTFHLRFGWPPYSSKSPARRCVLKSWKECADMSLTRGFCIRSSREIRPVVGDFTTGAKY